MIGTTNLPEEIIDKVEERRQKLEANLQSQDETPGIFTLKKLKDKVLSKTVFKKKTPAVVELANPMFKELIDDLDYNVTNNQVNVGWYDETGKPISVTIKLKNN